jgi:uncharacterized protein (DUF4415 family)
VNNVKKEYDFSQARLGHVRTVTPGRTRITIRLDDGVLDWFKAQLHAAGGNIYQTRINDALKELIGGQAEPPEATLRRVPREELAKCRARTKGGGRRTSRAQVLPAQPVRLNS